MKVTEFTRRSLHYLRRRRNLTNAGFIEVSESGDPLWKFQRGDWHNRKITEVQIGPDKKTLWIKVSDPPALNGAAT